MSFLRKRNNQDWVARRGGERFLMVGLIGKQQHLLVLYNRRPPPKEVATPSKEMGTLHWIPLSRNDKRLDSAPRLYSGQVRGNDNSWARCHATMLPVQKGISR